jgi:hypothetical protein
VDRSEFLTLAAGALGAPVILSEVEAAGRTFLQPLKTAPYPHPGRPYRDATVGIYVPPQYRAEATIDYIVHFHGWRNDVRHVLQRYRLREQLDMSRRNAILVVPQGPHDAPDSDFGKLEHDQNGLGAMLDDITVFLRSAGVTNANATGRVVLSTHSGGYGGAGGSLLRGGLSDNVSDVLLFDSAYGYYDAFAGWVKSNDDHHLLSVFTTDTENGNVYLMSLVQSPKPNIFVRIAHGMTLEQLQTRAPTFILTTVAHDELLQRYNWYALFLQATALTAV